MANGHRSQIKRERNSKKDNRPSAKLTYARIPVQKACIVMDAIRGKDLTVAEGLLTYSSRYASSVILKLLKSAAANAENNNGMNQANLFVAECYADNGPIMKRIQPRAQGRAYRILKRESHLTIVLDEKKGTAEAKAEDTGAEAKETAGSKAEKAEKKPAAKKPAAKTAAAKKPAAKKTAAKKPAEKTEKAADADKE
jgi:large subunit ribosomal protein L22